MCAFHVRRWLTAFCRPLTMLPGHVRHRQIDVCRLRTMSPSRCAQATADACRHWLMLLAVGQCHQMHTQHGFSCRPWPMSPIVVRCVQATAVDAQSMRTRHGLCVQALADAPCRLPTSFARCAHATSDACKPSLMPPAVGHFAWMTPTCHVRYVALLELLILLRGF